MIRLFSSMGFALVSSCTLLVAVPPAGGQPDKCLFFATPNIASVDGFFHPLESAAVEAFSPKRGTAVLRLTPEKPWGGYGTYVQIDTGSSPFSLRVGGVKAKSADKEGETSSLDIKIALELPYEDPVTTQAELNGQTPGQPLSVTWTWSGLQHRIYANGKLLKSFVAAVPFDTKENPAPIRILANSPDRLAAPVQELALYNFAMTPEQVLRAFEADSGQPFVANTPGMPLAAAQWAPGALRGFVAVDTGNALSDKVVTAKVTALRGAETVATASFSVSDGFG